MNFSDDDNNINVIKRVVKDPILESQSFLECPRIFESRRFYRRIRKNFICISPRTIISIIYPFSSSFLLLTCYRPRRLTSSTDEKRPDQHGPEEPSPCRKCGAPADAFEETARTAYLVYLKCSRCGFVQTVERPPTK